MVVVKVVGAIETELEMILQTGMVEEMVLTETVEEIVRETVGIGAMVVVKVVGTIETEMEMIVETGMVEDMVDIEAVMMVSDNLEVMVLETLVIGTMEVEMQSAQMIMILMMMKKLMLTAVLGMMILFRKMMKYSNVKSMRLNSTLILILNTI